MQSYVYKKGIVLCNFFLHGLSSAFQKWSLDTCTHAPSPNTALKMIDDVFPEC